MHPTNGFHPVWMFPLIVIFATVPGDQMIAVGVAQATILLLIAGTGAVLLTALISDVSKWSLALVPAMLLFSRYLSSLADGMESAVATFAVALFVLTVVRTRVLDRPTSSRADWLTGVVLGFALLSRLDLVFLAGATAAYVVYSQFFIQRQWPSRNLRALLRKHVGIWTPAVLMVVPYLAWNYIEFGSLVPVSGVIKSTFPQPEFELTEIRLNIFHILLMVPAFTGLIVTRREPERFGHFKAPLVIGLMMMMAHVAYTELFLNWAVFVWYFAAYLPFGIMGAVVTVEATRKLHRRAPAVAAIGAVVLTIVSQASSLSQLNGGFSDDGDNREFVVAAEEAGTWVEENLPEDARFGMKDSGSFSFHSQRNVTNLDGVIMNLDYQKVVCTGQLQEYLLENGVEYFVAHNTHSAAFGDYSTADFPILCRLPDGEDSTITVWESNEVYRGDFYFDGPIETRLIIWRLE